jgi:hypothetical protein
VNGNPIEGAAHYRRPATMTPHDETFERVLPLPIWKRVAYVLAGLLAVWLLVWHWGSLFVADRMFQTSLEDDARECTIPEQLLREMIVKRAQAIGGADPTTIEAVLDRNRISVKYVRVIEPLPGTRYLGLAWRLPREFQATRTGEECPS